jgi:hypothetical protein
MIEIYLKLIGRNLWKNKLFTVINLLGIVIAAVFILIKQHK